MRHYTAVLLFVVSSALTCVSEANQNSPLVVSIIQLIATPERFDGKIVSVIGYLRLDHEGHLLYLRREDYENVILENSLWIDSPRELMEQREKLEFKYVKIVGTFRAGHAKRNMFSAGGFTQLQSFGLWSDPDHPLEGKIKSMHQ